MAKRNRTNPVQFYLSDDEQYILNTKFKASGMKSMSAFLRKLILYGYVYDVDYSYLRNYNTELGRISSNLNQIAKRVNSTGNIYQEDINEVKELMNEVWHTQKSMLSKQPLIKPQNISATRTKPMNKSKFRLMRVRPKLRRSTLSIRLTIAGKTVSTKPIISYRLLLRARSVMRKRTASEKSLQTGFQRGNIRMLSPRILIRGIYTIISSSVRLTILNTTNITTAHRPTTASAA